MITKSGTTVIREAVSGHCVTLAVEKPDGMQTFYAVTRRKKNGKPQEMRILPLVYGLTDAGERALRGRHPGPARARKGAKAEPGTFSRPSAARISLVATFPRASQGR